MTKRKTTGLTGGKPRPKTKTLSQLKKEIQAKLRERAIERDGGCVLRHYTEAGKCGGYSSKGLILQGEHLVGRANSASYADMDNIVCLCKNHHFYFKRQHGAVYWDLVRVHIGEERWSKICAWERDKTPHHFVAGDWRDILEGL